MNFFVFFFAYTFYFISFFFCVMCKKKNWRVTLSMKLSQKEKQRSENTISGFQSYATTITRKKTYYIIKELKRDSSARPGSLRNFITIYILFHISVILKNHHHCRLIFFMTFNETRRR